jgi:epoxyqueuosine reductase
MWEELEEWAGDRGFRVAVGPGSLLREVKQEISGRANRGELDPWFKKTWLESVLEDDDNLPAETVIAMAAPSTATLVRFQLPDRVLTATIPPTYREDAGFDEAVRRELLNLFPGLNGDLRPAHAPKKALAAHLGLASYGLNNITYASGLGSYIRILAFVTSAAIETPRSGDEARVSTLPECAACGKCRDNCPTGAITGDRFLLRAERCLTAYNELPEDWPDWLPRAAHECLVGCMRCQEVCPCNEGLLKHEDSGILFDREETDAFLSGAVGRESTPIHSVEKKLAAIGMTGYSNVIGRNLSALIGSSYP